MCAVCVQAYVCMHVHVCVQRLLLVETLSPPWSSVSTEPPSNASLASLTLSQDLLVKWGAGTEPHLLGPLISHLLTGRGDRVHFVLACLYSPGQAPPFQGGL